MNITLNEIIKRYENKKEVEIKESERYEYCNEIVCICKEENDKNKEIWEKHWKSLKDIFG